MACFDSPYGTSNPNEPNAWSIADHLLQGEIRNLNHQASDPIQFFPFTAENGGGFTLEAGLYNFAFIMKDGTYKPVVVEVDRQVNVTLMLADLLDVNIYPVPITDNTFTVEMVANDDLRFNYQLLDDSGMQLYGESFSLKKDQEWKHAVIVESGIPDGILINRFEFSDGSVKTIQTIK